MQLPDIIYHQFFDKWGKRKDTPCVILLDGEKREVSDFLFCDGEVYLLLDSGEKIRYDADRIDGVDDEYECSV